MNKKEIEVALHNTKEALELTKDPEAIVALEKALSISHGQPVKAKFVFKDQ